MPHRLIWRKLKRFIVYRVLSLDDTPHRIALGVAVGMFVAWTPTIPFQMVLTVAISALLRANKFVGLPFVWVTNPLTLIPIYGPNYLLGCWLLPGGNRWSAFVDSMIDATNFSQGFWVTLQSWWTATLGFLLPLWVGSLIIGSFVGLASYLLTYWGVIRFRRIYHRLHDGKLASGKAVPPPPGADRRPRPRPPAAKPDGLRDQQGVDQADPDTRADAPSARPRPQNADSSCQ
jgi:hypothetical protein